MEITGTYHLSTKQREGITHLDKLFFTPPFNLVEVREDKSLSLLEMMVMNSSPGMLDGDVYDININVADDTKLNVQSQSYQRIYDAPNGTKQHCVISVGENAYCSFVPHPNVPCKRSNFHSSTHLKIGASSELVYADIVACGRKLMETNEIFAFDSYHAVTELSVDGRLFLKDNLYINPMKLPPNQLGLYEEFTYQLNLIYYNSDKTTIESDIASINRQLTKEKNCVFGVTKKANQCFVLRVLGHESELLFRIASDFGQQKNKAINGI